MSADALAISRNPVVRSLACRLSADRREGGPALRDFADDKPSGQVSGGVLGLFEHVLCAVSDLSASIVSTT